MNKRQVGRFLNLIQAVEESESARIDVSKASYKNGKPACPLAHYAARSDLQRSFEFSDGRHWIAQHRLGSVDTYTQNHFGITEAEETELFDAHDGKTSGTPFKSAAYLKRFLIRKLTNEMDDVFVDHLLYNTLELIWEA